MLSSRTGLSGRPGGRRWSIRAGLAVLGLLASTGCQVEYAGMTLPSGKYFHDDVQYFAPGPEFPYANTQAATQRAKMQAAGIPIPPELFSPWGGVFAELVRLGEACHARWEGGEARYAHREHWLPGARWNPPAADAANAELARRYFAGYGPASASDFAYWRAGSLAGESRRAFEAVAGELAEVETASDATGRGPRFFARRIDVDELFAAPPAPEAWPVRMLGRFDPLLLAHKDKGWVVPEKFYARVWRPAGHIEAVVLAHGRAVATWRYDRIGAGTLAVRVFPFKGALPQYVGKEVRRQAKEVARFFGLKPLAVRVERPAG